MTVGEGSVYNRENGRRGGLGPDVDKAKSTQICKVFGLYGNFGRKLCRVGEGKN